MAFNGGLSSSSSSFSSSIPQWDVFLSFRGEDTRTTFTAHLYAALLRNGINTFMDDKLRSGEEISPALLDAIEESKISIVVLSKNYASSRWCLNELIKILECRKTRGQLVLPLFYDVDPSEVRNQTNSVGEAFAILEKRFSFKDDEMKVKEWKTILTEVANLSGMHLGNRNEAEFIHEIIKKVNSKLVKKTYFQVAKYPVGIESRVQDVKSLLDIEKNDRTCIVGIFGFGGIGKTTLVKAIYNSIASQFEDNNCFLENIRETSGNDGGLIHLQNKLLSKILGDSSLMVDNVDQGITLIKQRLRLIRMLLVLDDVDHSDQLEKIIGKGDWFGLGSRIIITTRDKHLLTAHGVHSVYLVNKLDHNEALQLFSQHAFNRNRPDDDYVEVTKDAIRYSGGLPLAVTVLGSTLKDRDILYWKSKLEEYKKIPNDDILKKLRISWDVLDENAKNIFLDLACFFKGDSVEHVTKMLDSFGFHSYSGVKELEDKCLITWSSRGSLEMHDLLQEMGREIVRQESPNEPGKRSRLWFHEDVCQVLEGNTGTNKVEGILIDLSKPDLIRLRPDAFKKMERLRIFINRNALFSEEPNFLSNELRLLDWHKYPGESLPSNFCGQNLVVLKIPQSQLKGLKGVQNFPNMTIMDFSHCEFIRKIPDVSKIPNLEKLYLENCKNLVDVHPSVGYLDKLVTLGLVGCSNLRSFPRRLKMRSLKFLCLPSCSRLKNLPEIEFETGCLKLISFTISFKEQSSSGYFSVVETLHLHGNIHMLQHCDTLFFKNINMDKIIISWLRLQDSNYQFRHLNSLILEGCSKVDEFLKTVEDTRQSMPAVVSREESPISSVPELLQLSPPINTTNSNDGCSSILLPKLPTLNLKKRALSKSNFFGTLNCCSTLTILNLCECDIVTLPPCIKRFVRLTDLILIDCKQLKEILVLPPNLKLMRAKGCLSLAIFLEEGRRSQLLNTPEALFQVGTVFPELILGNHGHTESDFLIQHDCPSSLTELDLSDSAIVSLPAWLNKFVGLEYLRLDGCGQLEEIPELPSTLKWITLFGCHGLRDNMGDALQIRLMSEGHAKDHKFTCIFPGNTIPDCFSHCKEISNANSCEIDINESVHLDSVNPRFVFYAVFRTEHVPGSLPHIHVKVTNNVQCIYSHSFRFSIKSAGSDHVWLGYYRVKFPHHSQLKTDNLRVEFTCVDLNRGEPSKSVFFKSCGFRVEHRYEEECHT